MLNESCLACRAGYRTGYPLRNGSGMICLGCYHGTRVDLDNHLPPGNGGVCGWCQRAAQQSHHRDHARASARRPGETCILLRPGRVAKRAEAAATLQREILDLELVITVKRASLARLTADAAMDEVT